jgi:DNA-binding NtrC family response regulator
LRFATATRQAMEGYAWPGNVRELANAIERAVIASEGAEITEADLGMDELLPVPPAETPTSTAAAAPVAVAAAALPRGALLIPSGERNLARIEALVVRAVLDETGGQKSKAAELLGINRTTLYNKLRELDPTVASGESD